MQALGAPWVALPALVVFSTLSLIGSVTLVVAPKSLQEGLIVLVAFAALRDAFVHILPEVAALSWP